jgi:hypothetical protein
MTRALSLIHNGKEWRVGQPIRIPATKQEGVIVGCHKGLIDRDNLISIATTDGARPLLVPDSLEAAP